mgnify:CR=1 FL=1
MMKPLTELLGKSKEITTMLEATHISNSGQPEETMQNDAKEIVAAGQIPLAVLNNLDRLKSALLEQLPEAPIIVQVIHRQLLEIPEITYLLDDSQVADIVQALAEGQKIQITPEAKTKTTKQKIAALTKAAKELDMNNLRLEDF